MCSLEENLEPMKFNVKWSAESIGKKINEIKVSQLIGSSWNVLQAYLSCCDLGCVCYVLLIVGPHCEYKKINKT